MAKKKRVWRDWWEWELELKPYTYKRLKERDCAELELRRMMEHATNFRPAEREGRWIIETQFERNPWRVVVEAGARENKTRRRHRIQGCEALKRV